MSDWKKVVKNLTTSKCIVLLNLLSMPRRKKSNMAIHLTHALPGKTTTTTESRVGL